MKNQENMIDFVVGRDTAVVSFTNKKYINRIKKLYKERKEEFTSFYENKDGSVCAKIPLKWIRINPGVKDSNRPKRILTEEQKKELAERLSNGRKNKAK